ncbi:unnamed protein product [Oncorhynchus mykiss]|uniref:PBC domain-containing protein n=1 Tax=Oncorhynchus mykiss TaxID=8022 RepID=A0A060XKI8_ONCMY|nr:unnamed protein product [Oncorhynchus mykiss]
MIRRECWQVSPDSAGYHKATLATQTLLENSSVNRNKTLGIFYNRSWPSQTKAWTRRRPDAGQRSRRRTGADQMTPQREGKLGGGTAGGGLPLNFQHRKHALNCHRMKPALFSVLCEIKEKTGESPLPFFVLNSHPSLPESQFATISTEMCTQ